MHSANPPSCPGQPHQRPWWWSTNPPAPHRIPSSVMIWTRSSFSPAHNQPAATQVSNRCTHTLRATQPPRHTRLTLALVWVAQSCCVQQPALKLLTVGVPV